MKYHCGFKIGEYHVCGRGTRKFFMIKNKAWPLCNHHDGLILMRKITEKEYLVSLVVNS